MKAEPKSILIVANETVAKEITRLIGQHSEFEVLSSPESRREVVNQVKKAAPDIVILDNDLPDFDTLSAMNEIKNNNDKTSLVLLATLKDKADVLSAFREGAAAYLLKESLPVELVSALKAVKDGRAYFKQTDVDMIRRHMQHLELGSARKVTEIKNGIDKLSVREKELFPLLADGKSVKEIADIFAISPKTVEAHKYHIMEKLNLRKMSDLTKLAIIKDLIPL